MADNTKDELCAFIDAMDQTSWRCDENAGESATANENTTTEQDEPDEVDVWMDLSNAFESWLGCIIDVESRISTHQSRKNHHIDQSIQRMLEDGLLNTWDADDLRFIANSWLRLLNAYACYSIGCHTQKRVVISSLLDLFSSKQITKAKFINICSRL